MTFFKTVQLTFVGFLLAFQYSEASTRVVSGPVQAEYPNYYRNYQTISSPNYYNKYTPSNPCPPEQYVNIQQSNPAPISYQQVVPAQVQQVIPSQIQQVIPAQVQQVIPAQIPQVIPAQIPQVIPSQVYQPISYRPAQSLYSNLDTKISSLVDSILKI